MTELDRDWRLLIGGRNVAAARGAQYPTHSASTGELLAQAPAAGPDEVDATVKAALQEQREWVTASLRGRAGVELGGLVND